MKIGQEEAIQKLILRGALLGLVSFPEVGMKKPSFELKYLSSLAAMAIVLLPGCGVPGTSTPTPTIIYTEPQLEYMLFAKYTDFFWCDPDHYPVGRPGQEETNAQTQFPAIQANTAEFSAILQHSGLANKTDYTSDEKLLIYREHKKLTHAVQMTASGNAFQFVLREGEDRATRLPEILRLKVK